MPIYPGANTYPGSRTFPGEPAGPAPVKVGIPGEPRVIIPTDIPDGVQVLQTDIPVLVSIKTDIPGASWAPTEMPEYLRVNVGDVRGLGLISAAVSSMALQKAAAVQGRGRITVTVAGITLPRPALVRGNGKVTASVTMRLPGAATVTATARMDATAAMSSGIDGLVSGAGQVSATAVMKLPADGLVAGSGKVEAAIAGMVLQFAKDLLGQGQVSATALMRLPSAAAVQASGRIQAATAMSLPAARTLSGSGRVDAQAAMTLPGAASLTPATGFISATASAAPESITPMGLLQTVNFEGNPSGTWYEIPAARWGSSWAAYPLTVKDSAGTGVVVSGSGLSRITVKTQRSSGTGGHYGRYKINGNPNSATVSYVGTNPLTQVFDNVQLVHGDIVTPEYINNGGIAASRTFTNCSIVVEPMP